MHDIPKTIIALSLLVCLPGCTHLGAAARSDSAYTKYCEPGSAIVRKTRGTPPYPARPASPHGTCKS